MEEDASVAEQFWLLSPHLLASIGAQSLDFFRTYFKLLMSRVNQLQEEVVQEFESSRDTDQNKHVYLEKIKNDILPHLQALLNVDPKVKDVTTALVSSQVEETAAKVLAIGTSPPTTPGESSGVTSGPLAAKHPVNLWREVARNLNVLHGSP